MNNEELYEKLLHELDRSLVVDARTRQYWLTNFERLPVSAVTMFCEQLANENVEIDKLVTAGIDADPARAGQIMDKGKEAGRKLLQFEEAESRADENADIYLNQNL